ncbi:MAG: hypothetical protein ACI8Q6_002871, partial [Granulosicoccus sp.]
CDMHEWLQCESCTAAVLVGESSGFGLSMRLCKGR